jgi:hypothetical protein
MKQKQTDLFIKIACGVLIVSFFLNWISVMRMSMSAYDIVFGAHESADDMGFLAKAILLLLPVCGGVILYYHIKKQGVYPVAKKIAFAVPAALVVLFFLILNGKISELKQHSYGMVDISVTSLLSAGFWLSLLASGCLCYLGFREDVDIREEVKP